MDAAGNLARADKDRSCDKARFETPWQDRQTLLFSRVAVARDSFSPSCSWLSGLAENHERKTKCSICIALNSIGVGGS
jgi:hypothetical protein